MNENEPPKKRRRWDFHQIAEFVAFLTAVATLAGMFANLLL